MRYNDYELQNLVKIRYGKNQKKVVSEKGKYPIYGTGGLMGYSTEYLYDKPSVLIGRKGTINKVKYIEEPFWTVDTLFYTEVDEEVVIPKYLYYLMSLINFNNYNEGTTIPSLRTENLNRIVLNIPTIDYQKKVLSILNPIDEKIENNNKINKNLEQQAQTLYDKMMVSKVYPLKTLGSITQRNSLKVGNNNSITVLSALNTGNLKPSEEYFSKQVFSKDTSKYILVNEGDFAYNPARINIGSIGINDLGYIGCVSPVYIAFSVDPDYKAFFRFYLKTKGFREECKLRASGSVRQALNYIDFARIETQYPDREEAVIFNQQWNDYHDAICSIVAETEKLIELRDSLLPQLMSGKFNISDINI